MLSKPSRLHHPPSHSSSRQIQITAAPGKTTRALWSSSNQPRRTWRRLLAQTADVSDQRLDVVVAQLVAKGLHLLLAAGILETVFDLGHRLLVTERFLIRGVGHVLHAGHAAGLGSALAVGPMAGGAICFPIFHRISGANRRRKNEQASQDKSGSFHRIFCGLGLKTSSLTEMPVNRNASIGQICTIFVPSLAQAAHSLQGKICAVSANREGAGTGRFDYPFFS